ncbi:peptidase inhibitor family I36 protein [Streptomyces sp. NPDC021093]|uniref:peptidase inhibitor family I36 protein n=1 Tax=Streptomyces sp. NPDC021093 TaxID=3365112 RepID=UPI0037A6C451
MKNLHRIAAVGVASLSLATAGLVLAPSASASPADCPRSYVCVWNNPNFSGAPTWKSQGNLSNMSSSNGMSIINNGTAYPGADHIRYRVTWVGGQYVTGCLHYPPDSNSHYFTGGAMTMNYARWGGEC